jgi:hypothetical protein
VLSDTVDVFLFAIVGIPGAAISLTLLILGIAYRNVKLSIIGTLVSLGFCYGGGAYIVEFGTNYFDIGFNSVYFWLTFFALAGGNVLSAFAVWKGIYSLAAISITPFVVVAFFLASFAIRLHY